MAPSSVSPRCQGSVNFDPYALFTGWATESEIQNDDLESLVERAFGLKPNDNYVYHAVASVTLGQVQRAIEHGGQMGLHAWYIDEEGKQVQPLNVH